MPATLIPEDELTSIARPDGPPGKNRLLGEVGAVTQPLRLALRSRSLCQAPRGTGRHTVLIPG